MNHEDTIRHEIITSLCLIGEGEDGRRLFDFLPASEKDDLEKIAGRLCREGEVDRSELLSRLRKGMRLKRFSALEVIHPGWLLESLEGESPRLFGLLGRFLSGDKVRYLVDRLSPSDKARLPKVRESYKVSEEVGEIVRRLVEKKLAFPLPPASEGPFSFSHISMMKGDDLRVLFRDIGIEEIRKAFWETEPRLLRAFLSRFSAKEGREIRERIAQGGAVSPEEKREAQRHLVSLPLEEMPADPLFREVGYSVLARSLGPDERRMAETVARILSPEEGYRLKRIVGEVAGKAPPETLASRRGAIVERVSSLVRQGRIRRYWKEGPAGKGA